MTDSDDDAPRTGAPGRSGLAEQQRREQILTAACRLFQHYGAKKTTVADIAGEAGVGTGSVYLEFRSKTEIVFALSERTHHKVLAAMQQALAAEGPPRQRLRLAFDARFAAFADIANDGAHAAELLHCQSTPVTRTWHAFEGQQQLLLVAFLDQHAASLTTCRRPWRTSAAAAAALLAAYSRFAPPLMGAADVEEAATLLQEVHAWVLGVE